MPTQELNLSVYFLEAARQRGVGHGLERAGLSVVGDAAFFCLQEFVPFTRNSSFATTLEAGARL